MNTITLAPSAAGDHQFSKAAMLSEKYDGVQARWDGKCLTTRTGNAIAAPAWFIRQLPRQKLTGELWMGRGTFTECQSTVLRRVADDRWRRVRLMVFEGTAPEEENVRQVEQIRVQDSAHVRQFAEGIIKAGGEGAVVRDRGGIVKIKPCQDAEAVVVGHVDGNGQFKGHTGALAVKAGPILFNLGAGMSDAVRKNPPPLGAVVTYQFQGRHPSGIPRFPAFLRVRDAA